MITINATVNVYLANTDEVRDIRHSLAHLAALTNEILQAVVLDPQKLADVTARMKASAAELQAATKTASPTAPQP